MWHENLGAGLQKSQAETAVTFDDNTD